MPSFRFGTCVRFDPRAVALWLLTIPIHQGLNATRPQSVIKERKKCCNLLLLGERQVVVVLADRGCFSSVALTGGLNARGAFSNHQMSTCDECGDLKSGPLLRPS